MKAALFDEAHFFFTPVHGRIREMFQNPVGPFCTAYQNEKHTGLQRKNQIKKFILSDVDFFENTRQVSEFREYF